MEDVRLVVCSASLAIAWNDESIGATTLGTAGGGGADVGEPTDGTSEPVNEVGSHAKVAAGAHVGPGAASTLLGRRVPTCTALGPTGKVEQSSSLKNSVWWHPIQRGGGHLRNGEK